MTIAFSTKSNRWTTRYSFEPQAYFHVDQQLVGFSPKDKGGMVWSHDTATNVNNKFYGTNYNSSFSVVFNHDPSATKQYESFSIEGSGYIDWKVDFESSSGAVASTSSLTSSENDLYAEVPRSSTFNNGRLIFIGTADPSQFTKDIIESGSIKMKTVEGVVAKGPLVYVRGASSGVPVAMRLNSTTAFPALTVQSDPTDYVNVKSLNPKSKTLNLELNGLAFNAVGLLSGFLPYGDEVPLFVLDLSSGESMRGDWVKATFTTTTNFPDFEVYAVNIDQHNVNLDHSLGQNN